MAKNYRDISYFADRPDVVKVFEDLEALHDFCRLELLPFNPSDLYNKNSSIWHQFQGSQRGYRGRRREPVRVKRVQNN